MYKQYFFAFLILIFLAVIFWSSLSLQNVFFNAVSLIKNYFEINPVLGIGIFVGLAAISAMFSPFSSVPLAPAAVIIWGIIPTFLFLLSGWLVGETLAYFTGRYVGYPVIKKFMPLEKFEHYHRHFSPKTEFLLVFLFRLSMPAEIPGYILGIARYNFGKYFLATVLSELPFAFLISYAGEAFILNKQLVFIGSIAAAITIMSFMFYLFIKKLKTV